MSGEEYLTIRELADRLKIAPKTVKNKMALGISKKNVHFFSPVGLVSTQASNTQRPETRAATSDGYQWNEILSVGNDGRESVGTSFSS